MIITVKNCSLSFVSEIEIRSVLEFLEGHQEELKDKRVAVFVVCMAELFGHFTRKYIQKHYLQPFG
ncbi:hypothetical protein [Thermococcus sp. LS2]|uniref:hypothetical protein n=1 Tax=Thermococcus sp. LS2 TaxID=1638260 RepID=UPI00197CC654|nr:hypothetical protein [Thermococcus sp. LS2]